MTVSSARIENYYDYLSLCRLLLLLSLLPLGNISDAMAATYGFNMSGHTATAISAGVAVTYSYHSRLGRQVDGVLSMMFRSSAELCLETTA